MAFVARNGGDDATDTCLQRRMDLARICPNLFLVAFGAFLRQVMSPKIAGSALHPQLPEIVTLSKPNAF
jgi:hypothetical protein